MRKLTTKEAKRMGSLGAKQTWKHRYSILTELRELYGKSWKEHKFIGWTTEQLSELLEFHKKGKLI